MPGLRLITVVGGGSLELREDRIGPRHLFVFDDSLSLQVIATADFTLAPGQGMRPRTGAPGVLGLTPGGRRDSKDGKHGKDGKLVVHEMAAGGPVAVAGLGIGDVITAIDGRSVAALTAAVAERMLQD